MTFLPEKYLIRNILFSLAIILLFFGLLEGVLRLSGIQPKLRLQNFELPAWLGSLDPMVLKIYKTQLQAQGFVNEDVYAYQSDPELGYRLKPDLQLTVRNYSSAVHVNKMPLWTISSDARGFRTGKDGNPNFQKKKITRLIHVLGDSSSFGWGVEYEETYASVLKDMLNASRKLGEGAFALYNHSMPGFSSFQGRLLVQKIDSIRKGDLVLVSFGWNDSFPAITSDRLRHEVRTSLVGKLRHWFERFLFFRLIRSFLLNNKNWETSDSPPDKTRVSLEDYRQNLEVIFNHISDKGGHPVFVSVCNFYDYPSAAFSVSRKSGVPFFNFPEQLSTYLPQVMERFPKKFATYYEAYGNLMEKSESLIFLFPDNCHPNAIGHHLMGETIFQTLQGESRQ